MKTEYCEIVPGRNCVTINYYSERQYAVRMARQRAKAKWRQRLNRVRETAGVFIGAAGFLLLIGEGGTETWAALLSLKVVGLGLLLLGAWMGRAFYGQAAQGNRDGA